MREPIGPDTVIEPYGGSGVRRGRGGGGADTRDRALWGVRRWSTALRTTGGRRDRALWGIRRATPPSASSTT